MFPFPSVRITFTSSWISFYEFVSFLSVVFRPFSLSDFIPFNKLLNPLTMNFIGTLFFERWKRMAMKSTLIYRIGGWDSVIIWKSNEISRRNNFEFSWRTEVSSSSRKH